jgi:hypothetical protein
VVLNGRWGAQGDWKKARKNGTEEKFVSDEKRIKEFDSSFEDLSLEYKLSNINQAKAFAEYLNEIGCFYTDKYVDFDMVRSFAQYSRRLKKIGKKEHTRWVQEHIDMGWGYVDEKIITDEATRRVEGKAEFKNIKADNKDEQDKKDKAIKGEIKKLREYRREHWDMIPDDIKVNHKDDFNAQIDANYDRLPEDEKGKDTEPMECMLAMLKVFSGIRVYKLK